MANKKISELPAANPIGVGDLFEIMQGGVNKKVNGDRILDFVADESATSSVLEVDTTSVGNIGTGEDVLHTYTLEADRLNTDGQFIRGHISGIVANNANVKTIKLKFGATTFLTRGTTTPVIGQGYTIDWWIIRTGATSQKCSATFSGSDGIVSAYYSAAGETLSGAVDIVLTGETDTAVDNDVVKHSFIVLLGFASSVVVGGDLNVSDFVTRETPTGAVNDINVTYVLANTPFAFLHVYLNGVLQDEGGGNDYTISGATITMTSAPSTGSKIRVSYIK